MYLFVFDRANFHRARFRAESLLTMHVDEYVMENRVIDSVLSVHPHFLRHTWAEYSVDQIGCAMERIKAEQSSIQRSLARTVGEPHEIARSEWLQSRVEQLVSGNASFRLLKDVEAMMMMVLSDSDAVCMVWRET